MPKKNLKKFILVFLFFFFLIFCLISIIEIILKIKNNNHIKIHQTNYYNKVLKQDPYKFFTVQYFHPYYLFSLPWQHKYKNLNNDIISINNNGFRINPSNKNGNSFAYLLGGSTAFGHFATSNDTTIASYLSKETNYNFLNLNAPSWNSHQELIALLKNGTNYKLSISLSFANDALIFCYQNIYQKSYLIDQPENSHLLNSIINNKKKESFFNDIKKYFSLVYSNIYKILKNNNKNNKILKCRSHIKNLTKNFLKNQKKMHDISETNNAKHLTIFQPIYSLHNNIINQHKKYDENFSEFLKDSINLMMKSEYCKNYCLNFSNVFNQYSNYNLMLKDILKEKKKFNKDKIFFIDEVHLTDYGSKIISKKIAKFLKESQYLR